MLQRTREPKRLWRRPGLSVPSVPTTPCADGTGAGGARILYTSFMGRSQSRTGTVQLADAASLAVAHMKARCKRGVGDSAAFAAKQSGAAGHLQLCPCRFSTTVAVLRDTLHDSLRYSMRIEGSPSVMEWHSQR